jgi:hypothetical protein
VTLLHWRQRAGLHIRLSIDVVAVAEPYPAGYGLTNRDGQPVLLLRKRKAVMATRTTAMKIWVRNVSQNESL